MSTPNRPGQKKSPHKVIRKDEAKGLYLREMVDKAGNPRAFLREQKRTVEKDGDLVEFNSKVEIPARVGSPNNPTLTLDADQAWELARSGFLTVKDHWGRDMVLVLNGLTMRRETYPLKDQPGKMGNSYKWNPAKLVTRVTRCKVAGDSGANVVTGFSIEFFNGMNFHIEIPASFEPLHPLEGEADIKPEFSREVVNAICNEISAAKGNTEINLWLPRECRKGRPDALDCDGIRMVLDFGELKKLRRALSGHYEKAQDIYKRCKAASDALPADDKNGRKAAWAEFNTLREKPEVFRLHLEAARVVDIETKSLGDELHEQIYGSTGVRTLDGVEYLVVAERPIDNNFAYSLSRPDTAGGNAPKSWRSTRAPREETPPIPPAPRESRKPAAPEWDDLPPPDDDFASDFAVPGEDHGEGEG